MMREFGAGETLAEGTRGVSRADEQERPATEKARTDGTFGDQRVDGYVWNAGNVRREDD